MSGTKRHPYPFFAAALEQLGRDDVARAAALGVSRRMISDYRAGTSLPHVLKLKRCRALDIALSLDVRRADETAR